MDRKEFIFKATFLSFAPFFPIKNTIGKNFAKKAGMDIWYDLVDYARWCPSPHNVQPWKLKVISSSEAHLYYDPKRVPIIVDGTSSFTTAGMGMFIECLNIAAGHHGLKVTAAHEFEPYLEVNSPEHKLFARLLLSENVIRDPMDRELLKKRRTSRLPYDEKLIAPSIKAELMELASGYGYRLVFSTDQELIDYSIQLNNESVLIRSEAEDARKEMCKWIRTTDHQAETSKDGWWWRCVGISGRMLHNFFFHPERFDSPWKKRMAMRIMNNKMKGTRTLAWLTGPFESRQDWVNAGHMLQRLWLTMTKHNLYLHPFGPIITTPNSKNAFMQKIKYDEKNGTLWFLWRMGYGKEPARSYRLDVNDILV